MVIHATLCALKTLMAYAHWFVRSFYHIANGYKPLLAFLEDLRKRDRILHKLVVAGIRKPTRENSSELVAIKRIGSSGIYE